MTVWIVIIIRGLMTNIHDPLVVVVPCLSAGPAVLSRGCSNQSLLTATNLNSDSRAETSQSSELNTMMM